MNVSRCNAGVVPDHDVAVVDYVADSIIYHSRLTNYGVRNVDTHCVVTIGVDVSVVYEAAADVAVCCVVINGDAGNEVTIDCEIGVADKIAGHLWAIGFHAALAISSHAVIGQGDAVVGAGS